MKHNFELELRVLEDSENIENKLMIFSLYYDLYHELMNRLSSITSFFQIKDVNEYRNFLEKSMEECICSFNSKNEVISIETFFNEYFYLIKKHDISKIWMMNDIIDDHKKDFEQSVCDMRYVRVLETMNLDFQTKANVIMIFKEHMNDVYWAMLDVDYDPENMMLLYHDILYTLSFLVPDLLQDPIDLNTFQKLLKKETKRIIATKVENGVFDLFDFSNVVRTWCVDLLDEIELNVYRLRLLHFFAGYQLDDSEFETMIHQDVYDKFHMSKETYITVMTSINTKFKKFEKDLENELNELTPKTKIKR